MRGIAFLPLHLLQTSFLFVISVTFVRFFGILDGNLISIVTPFILWYMRSVLPILPIFPNYCLLLYVSSQLSLRACVSSKFVINFLYWQRVISMFFLFIGPYMPLSISLIIFVNQDFCFSCTFNMISAAFLIVYFKLFHLA